MGILNFTQPLTDNFLVDIIAWLIKISSSIAIGVVLFTVLLKLVTLPFDYISRASMRKNSLKMEEMRPELEKLQEQYANDKALYQQKMMALYKKNGYSMMGACLPTILTLVIFIVAINAFTNFSQYQNKQYFYNMSKAYNNVVYAGLELDEGETAYITRGVEGELIIKGNTLYELYVDGNSTVPATDKDGNAFNYSLVLTDGATNEVKDTNGVKIAVANDKRLTVTSDNSYVKAIIYLTEYDYAQEGKENEVKLNNTYFEVVEEKLNTSTLKSEENNFLKIQPLDEDGNFILDANGNKVEKTFAEAKAENATLTAEAFILDIRQQKSADVYREEEASFLWVKNIWVTDSPLSHPVEESWEEFKTTHEYEDNDIGEDGYASLTKKLTYEKSAPNGYFILVVLTAGSSLLTQLVMGKSQKAQMELQSVDGRGMQTQKTMMIIMPIMMAVFAFMYTSAFSIYIVLSSLISMGTTIGINKIVDFKFKRENQAKSKGDSNKVHGRIYVAKKEQTKEEPKKGKKSKAQENAHGENDFLSGKQDDNKHIRGRLK